MSRTPELDAIFYRYEGAIVDGSGELLHNADNSIVNSYHFCEHLGIVSVNPNFDATKWGQRFRTWSRIDSVTTASGEDELIGEIYELALEKAGINGARAMVIEGRPEGILAAKKLGCTVVGFTTPKGQLSPREARLSGADEALSGYYDLDVYIAEQMEYHRARAKSRVQGV